MCGIVAMAGFVDAAALEAMNRVQVHRGPDSAGRYLSPDGGVGFAMRRLSIIDLESGHQPIANEDGDVVLVCNGEIYNSPQLRERLAGEGHRFRTRHSDVETIVHLYEAHGTDCLRHLNGMFGFCLHDRRRNLVFGARDRLGIKPLYYARRPGALAVASEIKSLLMLDGVEPRVNRQSLFHYMTLFYMPDSASILEGIERVPPGHFFVYDVAADDFRIERYWAPKFDRVARTPEEAKDLVRAGARAAVQRWTLADVPIACSLSGGLDSASVVGLLAEAGQGRIKTYTLGFAGADESAHNETGLARLVADKWGTEHHEIILSPDGLLDELVDMIWALDEPYGGGLPSWHVFKLMAQDVKVAMTGSGGDELFGNYHKPKFWEAGGARRLSILGRWLARSTPGGAGEWFGRLREIRAQQERYPFGGVYPNQYKYFSDADKRRRLFAMPLDAIEDTGAYLQRLYDASGADGIRNGLAAVDLRTQLAEEFLHMTDRFSMAHSLEARVPFLDHEFVEQVFTIDPRLRSTPAEMKHLLKHAMADLLPAPLLTARKHGFTIPIALWLRRRLAPVARHLLGAQRLEEQGYFAPDFAERYLEPHLAGRRDFHAVIWAALMFQLWHLVFIERRCRERPSFRVDDLVG
ncbi:MAG: asparagine synthase (glutamine-hydrolyzing) [Gammaproteobacteria bacterium]|nr:asparagine synthase (glutamine-hydrolyzing) [Gammaproteobacteria bacterium]